MIVTKALILGLGFANLYRVKVLFKDTTEFEKLTISVQFFFVSPHIYTLMLN